MTETATLETLQREIYSMKEDISYIKEHIIDLDLVLTEDDEKSLKKAKEDLASGRTRKL